VEEVAGHRIDIFVEPRRDALSGEPQIFLDYVWVHVRDGDDCDYFQRAICYGVHHPVTAYWPKLVRSRFIVAGYHARSPSIRQSSRRRELW
jgi:hypothetical protein